MAKFDGPPIMSRDPNSENHNKINQFASNGTQLMEKHLLIFTLLIGKSVTSLPGTLTKGTQKLLARLSVHLESSFIHSTAFY